VTSPGAPPPYRGRPLATREHILSTHCRVVRETPDALTVHYPVSDQTRTWRRSHAGSSWFEEAPAR
jgi:hypothetical protein